MTFATAILRDPHASASFPLPNNASLAADLAAANFERNRAALERRWPRSVLALPDSLPELEWSFARDGSLTGRHVDRRWFNDVSVPGRAADRMLKRLSVAGRSAVLLAPTHACQLRRSLELLPKTHALIAVIPGETNAGVIAACDDFSADIGAGRLWLAIGPDWADELKAILDGNDGLMPPQTMIRVPGLNTAVIEHVARPCDVLLSTHARNHTHLIGLLNAKPRASRTPVKKVCVVTSAFALWDDAASLLVSASHVPSLEVVAIDVSSPAQASDLRLAKLAGGCDAIVTANVGRADRPGIILDNLPWITWVTRARVPKKLSDASGDRLAIADEALRPMALAQGWCDEQISVAAEPWSASRHEGCGRVRGTVNLIADLPVIAVPSSVQEMSSLRLIWDAVERDIAQAPLCHRASVEAFLLSYAERIGIARENFPVELFRERLVLPTFARAAAVELSRMGLDFAIFGRGWESVAEVSRHYRGSIRSADDFKSCLRSTATLLDMWPGSVSHAAARAGRPLVTLWGRTPAEVIAALKKPAAQDKAVLPKLDLATLVKHLSAAN